jgi:phosphoglucosamine mutase
MGYFGTDGIRGIANKDLTPEFALKLGIVLTKCLEAKKGQKIIIGQDTRISNDMLNYAIQSGILSMGIDVLDVGIIPTSAISFLVRKFPDVIAGIMISASHNPFEYNGIKIFGKNGLKIPDEMERKIEELLDLNTILYDRPHGENIGKSIKFKEGKKMYIDFLKNILDTNLLGWKIMIDCANGCISEIGPKLFKELDAEIVAINCSYDGININKECGATFPQKGLEEFIKSDANIGFSYDGDGDRLIVFSEDRKIVNGDQILGIFASYLKKKNSLKGNTVVGTIMTNLGLEEYLKKMGITLIRTKVGDRHILEKIINNDYNLGGEPSGHIILYDYLPTGDGLLTSIFLLKILIEEKIRLKDLIKEIPLYPQETLNIPLGSNKKISEDQLEKVKKIVEEVIDKDRVRYIIRQSGTEYTLRITLEGDIPESLLLNQLNIIKERILSEAPELTS